MDWMNDLLKDPTSIAVIGTIVMLLFGSKLRPFLDPIAFALGYVPKDQLPPTPSPANPLAPVVPSNIVSIITLLQSLLNRKDAKGNEAAIIALETYKAEAEKIEQPAK
jgi:hypothetical protein